eukprot:6651074-Pyramimonas_sp.AAC.1
MKYKSPRYSDRSSVGKCSTFSWPTSGSWISRRNAIHARVSTMLLWPSCSRRPWAELPLQLVPAMWRRASCKLQWRPCRRQCPRRVTEWPPLMLGPSTCRNNAGTKS